MTRRLFVSLGALACLAGSAFSQSNAEPRKPKLVVGIVIDQFRYDYLTRFRSEYTGGLARLLEQGAVFTNARYKHSPTITALGHSIVMSGAVPAMSGIAGNEWYDRETGKVVTSVSDPATKLLGGKEQEGSSPRKFLQSTVGDELKTAARGKARVIGVSIKDRAAILPAGHSADGAYWFDGATGNFVSSTFYFADLPQWAKAFNATRAPDRYVNVEWKPLVPSPDYPLFSKRMAATASSAFYNSLEASPYGNELVEAFAERAIEGEQLGRRGATDLITVSFSANDYVGHRVGPDAPEVRDMAIRVDRTIGKLFEFIDKQVRLDNTLVVFTADHGVAPLPETLAERRMPGGRHSLKDLQAAVKTALDARFGAGDWVLSWAGGEPYLDRELIRSKKLDEGEVQRTAAEALANVPHIFRVLTRDQIMQGQVPDDAVSRAVLYGFVPRRSGDLVIIEDPYWITAASGATHGAPFGYDAHVPVVFMGPNVKAGRYDANVAPNDIAPTLATMLDIETPSGADGRVLAEMLARP
jgi:predicted AlkP superfamily pyrophosphatase or phosphodiesterase